MTASSFQADKSDVVSMVDDSTLNPASMKFQTPTTTIYTRPISAGFTTIPSNDSIYERRVCTEVQSRAGSALVQHSVQNQPVRTTVYPHPIVTCSQHQPIYNPIYGPHSQSGFISQEYHITTSQCYHHQQPFAPTLYTNAGNNDLHQLPMNSGNTSISDSVNTALSGYAISPVATQYQPTQTTTGVDVRPTLSLNLQHCQSQCRAFFDHDLTSIRSAQTRKIQDSVTPARMNLEFSSAILFNQANKLHTESPRPQRSRSQIGDLAAGTTLNHATEKRRGVDHSDDSSLFSSTGAETTKETKSSSDSADAVTAACVEGKFKSYLMHLVFASNIPFAYAIILVAFLITIIAATSIITILTIILTISGYTASPSTDNPLNISLAIGVVCASFTIALVVASLVVWRRHCQAAYYYLDDPQSASRGTNSPQLSETYDDSDYGSLPVSEWSKHVQKLHADGDIGFSREFEQIQQASNTNSSCEHSQLPENKHKNRYINIMAYDHTRVTLRQLPGQKKPGSDYINANYIDGYNKPRAYIGTQGPLVSTCDDYWRMIWEQRVVIIVMITNLQERGRRKCDMYWPKEGSETYGQIQVKLLQEVVMATYTLRTFTARNLKMKKRSPNSERTVYQYHYTNWPDHGVPDHPLPVLSFVRKSASANPPSAGPIICHCSAGCGRSGTYIVIDAMLRQIRHRQSINVVDFLKHIRAQRNYLVQTEEQYIFIHDSLVEAIESGETEIASNFVAKYIQLLQTGGTTTINGNASGKLLSNYSLSNSLQPRPPNGLSVSTNAMANAEQQLIGQLVDGTSSPSNLLPGTGSTATAGGGASSTSSSRAGQWSLLERQYRLVASFKAKDFNVVSALKPCNKTKNRTLNLIPLEAHRVHITPKPGQDGSDYINATFLMGFNHLREFIVTQHPVHETFSDFWQMVYDHNSQTIVLLTPVTGPDATDFAQFWPQKEDEVDYGSFKVKLIQEATLDRNSSSSSSIVVREFIMRSNQDDYELQTRIIQGSGWPESCGPLSNVFELIQVVQNASQQQASRQQMHDGRDGRTTTVTIGQEHEPQNGGPVIVVDRFGGTEAATFAVLTTLYKQINFEDAVDVYMYAKLAHLRRPGIWSSQDDYLFLYRAIENYASQLAADNAARNNASNTTTALIGAPSLPAVGGPMTMTLDRHRHGRQSSSSNRSAALRGGTSTMRRPTSSNQGTALVASQQVPSAAATIHPQTAAKNAAHQAVINELSKSRLLASANANVNSALFDQNHNLTTLGGATGLADQRNQQQVAAVMHLQQQQQQQQQQQPLGLRSNGSPYNSANSIGTSPHQHLLAGEARAPSGGAPMHLSGGQADYLYPIT